MKKTNSITNADLVNTHVKTWIPCAPLNVVLLDVTVSLTLFVILLEAVSVKTIATTQTVNRIFGYLPHVLNIVNSS